MELQNSKAQQGLLQDDEIDLRQYWLTLMRHKWGIVGFSLLVTLLTALVVFSLEPIYRATATLLIESKQAKVVSIEEMYGLDSSGNEYYQTQFEILKSRKLAEIVVRQYDLDRHPEFNREPALNFNWRELAGQFMPDLAPVEPSDARRFQGKVDAFMARLTIEPVRKTQLVSISFDAYSPEFAAKIANAVGEAYINSNLEGKLEQTLKASGWLNERMGGLKGKLQESEAILQQFREQEQIVGDRGGLEIASAELDLVASKLADSRRERLDLESRYQQIQNIGNMQLDGAAERYERIPAVLSHPVVQSYKQSLLKVEQKKSELSQRYGPKHPSMIAVDAELVSARRALNQQIISVVKGIENQYRVALSNERSLDASLSRTKEQMQEIKRKEYRLRQLELEALTSRKLYDTFFTRLNETAATGDLSTAIARNVDPAVPPNAAAKPKKRLIIALSLVLSLMVGVLCALLLEALNNTIRSTGDVQEKLAQAMLGLLPKLQSKEVKGSYRHYIEDGKSGFSEAVRTIRTGLVLSALDNPHKVIAVTSTVPGEGKTTCSLSLAYSLGQMERVLLIDADMRRPSIGKLFQFGPRAPGLSNLVAGTSTLEECIHTLTAEGIDVISAGTIPPNPLELLSSARFRAVLEDLEGRYDRIVIDTAPCQAVSDALVLAGRVGSMVYVIKADSTPSVQIKAGLRRLAEVNAPVVGVVLNAVDMAKASRYYGEGYSGYYDVYAYRADETAA